MKFISLIFALAAAMSSPAVAQGVQQDHILYGVAYYDEYMPAERLAKDVAMMKDAGRPRCATQLSCLPLPVVHSRRRKHACVISRTSTARIELFLPISRRLAPTGLRR